MSFRTYLMLTSGLKEPIQATEGTFDRIMGHGRGIQSRLLGLEPAEWENAAERMRHHTPDEVRAAQPRGRYKPSDHEAAEGGHYEQAVRSETLCAVYEEHNAWVRHIYESVFTEGRTLPEKTETITPEQAALFWPFFAMIGEIPIELWTREHAQMRNEGFYEVMRGREAAGEIFDAEPLTPKQAAAVLNLFSPFFDPHDQRFDVAKGRDELTKDAGYDGEGHRWCEVCGAVNPEDGCMADKEEDFNACPPRAHYGCEDFGLWGNAPPGYTKRFTDEEERDEDDAEDEEGDGQ